MRAATERRSVAAAILLACLAGCDGSRGPAPATRPPASPTPGDAWSVPAPIDEGALVAALNAERAVEILAVGRLAIGDAEFPFELLLNRSGAMRLEVPGGALVMVSDGARLRTDRELASEEAVAWRTANLVPSRPDLALSPFDLAAALVPSPWPDSWQGGARVSIARVPEGTWVALLEESAEGGMVARRRALVSVAGVVTVREDYDSGGFLERVVRWVERGRQVEIRRPRTGSVVRLYIDALERDPERPQDAYRVDR